VGTVVEETKVRERLGPINRRKFVRLTALAAAAALGADSVLLEPNLPRLVRKEISLRRWPARLDGFTIALLSDFHYDPVFSAHPIKAAAGIVNRLHPDLIVLTGDFVSAPAVGRSAKAAAAAEPCSELLQAMQAPHGVWAVMGNHDAVTDSRRVMNALRSAGIHVLANHSAPIERDGGRFWLAGVDDVLEGRADLHQTLHSVPSDEATVLLAHEPDYADYVAGYRVDLQLSGHTHGGQVRLPFIRPLYLPALAKKYISGLHEIRALTLYTNVGIGTVGLPLRLNCPPEVTLLTLRRS
jgi:predicted MPP superfamily phosphohydrolase